MTLHPPPLSASPGERDAGAAAAAAGAASSSVCRKL
jgi:hypothetical protein